MAEDFTSIGILEKDSHGDVLWSWIYPSIPVEWRAVILRRINIGWDSPTGIPFLCGRFRKHWNYCYTEDVSLEKNPKVTRMVIVLTSTDFNPEKYAMLGRVLMKLYKKSYSPTVLLENFLLLITKGVCGTEENGAFKVQDYDGRLVLRNSKIKDILKAFGLEAIFIYVAILLKKRIIVYHPDLETLMNICRALPTLACHRLDWKQVFPLVTISDDELVDLKESSAYVAGFVDIRVENRSDLYDIFVNSHSSEISVASHAKDAFAMGKLHKDIATFMVEVAEGDGSDIHCIKEISRKTKDLLNSLKNYSVEDDRGRAVIVGPDSFKDKKLPAATKGFLLNLAAAEGMLKL